MNEINMNKIQKYSIKNERKEYKYNQRNIKLKRVRVARSLKMTSFLDKHLIAKRTITINYNLYIYYKI